jgi:hypothetical protein
MLARTCPGSFQAAPWSLTELNYVSLLLFVHRVQGVVPGLYFLDRCARLLCAVAMPAPQLIQMKACAFVGSRRSTLRQPATTKLPLRYP